MTTIPSSSPMVALLEKARPSALTKGATEATEFPSHDLILSIYPDLHYTEHEKEEINQWLATSSHIGSTTEDAAKSSERLSSLNTHLSTKTTLLGSKPSLADVALYARLAPLVSKWTDEERTGEQGYHHIVRHLLFVQDSSKFGLQLPASDKLSIDEDKVLSPIKPVDAKAEKERKKREKEAASAASRSVAKENESYKAKNATKSTGDTIAAAVGSSVPLTQSTDGRSKVIDVPRNPVADDSANEAKAKKKEKQTKPKKAPEPPKETPTSPALIDLRVGHILKAVQHPNADSLYVSTIACGDPQGTENTSEYEGQICRTVCSGLNGLVPLEEMQGRKIVAVCNLKPVTMRGIKSAAMVLAASPRLAPGEEDNHKGPVELVEIPEGAPAGTRIWFEGWEGEPEGVLNPKKKIWENCQVGFTTTDDGEVAFDAGAVEKFKEEGKTGISKLVTQGFGVCKVKSLKGATVR